MLLSMAFTLTDLPEPVEPAMSRWGIVARSLTNGSPWMVLPSASVSFELDRRYTSDSSSSRSEITSRLGFGIWMPTVDLPGMRSINDRLGLHRQAQVVGEAGDLRCTSRRRPA